MDVLEMDAASNRGIDDVRDLREVARVLPVRDRYRVFIVDEAHQLTKDAFGALLKILEEPPAHVVFILASTEKDKFPATILSRCLQVDFRPIPSELVVARLAEVAAKEGLGPLDYMRKYGAFLVEENPYGLHEKHLGPKDLEGAEVDPATRLITRGGAAIGVEIDGVACAGFPTPSRRLEFFSPTLKQWKWPEQAIPTYVKSHVHPDNIDRDRGEMLLLPTFRLPTLVHTRSGNAKWLYEISHRNPLWLHPQDAARFGVATGDLLKVNTEIGYFIDKVWVTEGIRPGVVACSHHLGRWRLREDTGGERWATALVDLRELEPGKWMMRQIHGIQPFASEDADSERVWWEDAGVHQNLTFPVQPDPISGAHCWHQKVRMEKPGPDDRYGDILVDTTRSHEVYRRWLALARPAPGPGGLRRPLWLPRVYRPAPGAFYIRQDH